LIIFGEVRFLTDALEQLKVLGQTEFVAAAAKSIRNQAKAEIAGESSPGA